MKLSTEERIEILNEMKDLLINKMNDKTPTGLCFVFWSITLSDSKKLWDIFPKSLYFKPFGVGRHYFWYDTMDHLTRIDIINDLIDIELGCYKPGLLIRIRNVFRYIDGILSH